MLEIKFIGPALFFVLMLALLAVLKPKFVQTNGSLSIAKAVGVSLVLALILGVVLYFMPM